MNTIKKNSIAFKFHTTFCVCIVSLFLVLSCEKKEAEFKFQNESLTTEERATDLISQMTLREKISQMRYDAPSIERLGVPEYNWWNECLHGVARAGEATVFPQAIGMGATWNPELIFKMGTVVSDEARAKYHKFISEGQRKMGQGLTFWTPNINIFRDPRWGRGQETYGEDPYLTSRMGVNYINGLQGDDDKHLKVVATAKHFAVHSGPEKSRHQDNYVTTKKDLYETYLPAFEAAVKEAKVHSVMCAYNRYNDKPCCGSDLLLQKILREDWGFKGYVVSDCWAVTDFWEEDKHAVVKTPEEAAALAVTSGTDLNCGSVYDPNLNEAVLKQLINEEELDVALVRLFSARFKLGMFDDQKNVKWSKIPYEVVASEKHYKLSEQIARESMVLLKNDNNILPLSKNIKSIAVIGPNADSKQALLGNYHGTPHNFITPLKGLQEKLPNATINYALGSYIAEEWPTLKAIPKEVLKNKNSIGLHAEYFDNNTFKGEPVLVRNDETVDFTWTPKRPLENLKSDYFSVRWSGEIVPKESGKYRIGLKAGNYAKLYVNDSLKFEYSADYEPKLEYFDAKLTAKESYKIRIEYSNTLSDPQAHLVWAKLNTDLLTPAIEAAKKSEVVILCLGLSPEVEGEEMSVVIEGFDKGDRSKITLPKTQLELVKKIQKLGKPTVVVLMNGSALAINWTAKNIPAILEAWYPGEFGGSAIADILFGDYNPSGKLPITFYKSVKDLPDFKSYDMENRTYKYFKGEPLFPFGHGLSYSTFEYSNLKISEKIEKNEDITISVDVKNTSKYSGEEVVQTYVSHDNSTIKNNPIRSLVDFKKVFINSNETKTITFKIPSKKYARISEEGKRVIESGILNISIGGKQPDKLVTPKDNVLITKVQIQ
ncbi:glycoside hydrolase family 3 C-terminal domain-containing protein [Polaribacter sp. PL03]|uniref:glycoside hydrolase family 3 protein n=1 Tax=Polaribacter sp. PL03 TaxID=3088353 RepID=UPI0029D23EBC|nr:glycoside hydrolase family 3 C-terminal domain-containing protein [Polaribacter sp. PL03]MDX6746610.1 glycoside hydrolase family 3 C-terminal domain-containing protein [Polaribacter sp. PL03]